MGEEVPRLVSDRPGIRAIRLIPLQRVGTAHPNRPFALLAVATELRAGYPVGLGLGAAGGEVDRKRFLLRRARHLIPPDTVNIRP